MNEYEISWLASCAAVDADNMHLGREVPFDAFYKLRSMIQKSGLDYERTEEYLMLAEHPQRNAEALRNLLIDMSKYFGAMDDIQNR